MLIGQQVNVTKQNNSVNTAMPLSHSERLRKNAVTKKQKRKNARQGKKKQGRFHSRLPKKKIPCDPKDVSLDGVWFNCATVKVSISIFALAIIFWKW